MAAPAREPVCATRAHERDETGCVAQDKVDRVRRTTPSDGTVEQAAVILRPVGDPSRLRIARALVTEELCVCDIVRLLGLLRPTVSHSLRALRQIRIVRHRRVGKSAYYVLHDAHVRHALDGALAHATQSEAAR